MKAAAEESVMRLHVRESDSRVPHGTIVGRAGVSYSPKRERSQSSKTTSIHHLKRIRMWSLTARDGDFIFTNLLVRDRRSSSAAVLPCGKQGRTRDSESVFSHAHSLRNANTSPAGEAA